MVKTNFLIKYAFNIYILYIYIYIYECIYMCILKFKMKTK